MPRRKQIDQTPRPPTLLSRRMALGCALSGLYSLSAARAAPGLRYDIAANLPGDGQSPAPLIVAGIADSQCGHWASVLAPLLADALQYAAPFTLTTTTGWDGVTGANLFDIQQEQAVPPSGIIAPGTVVLAALTGDSRVHYDYLRWVPTFISQQPTVAVGKAALHRSFAGFLKGQPLRVGVSRYGGAELPTVLALDLLSLRPLPITGFATPDAAIDALRAGTVDVIQLPFDADYNNRIAALQDDDFLPLFANAPPHSAFQNHGLPLDFATVYRQERHRVPAGLLYNAWAATAAAVSMKAGLMLPILSPPATVARWRHACQAAAAAQEARDHARDENQTMLTGAACISAYAEMSPDISVIMALRRWIALNVPRWRDAAARRSSPAAAQQNPN